MRKFNPLATVVKMARLTWRGVLLYARVSVILSLHGLFVLLVLLRTLSSNEKRSPSWYVVFSPLFVFDTLAIIYWCLYLFSYVAVKRDEDSLWSGRNSSIFPGQRISLLYLVAFAVGIALKMATEILLSLLLEDRSVRLFVPAIFLGALLLEVTLVAGYEAVLPLLRVASSALVRNVDCEGCRDSRCFICVGYTDLCCRRCLYFICVACT